MNGRFICGVCHRERPKNQREKGQARCRDRKACAEAARLDLLKNWAPLDISVTRP